jgi:hypothetical protein
MFAQADSRVFEILSLEIRLRNSILKQSTEYLVGALGYRGELGCDAAQDCELLVEFYENAE